MNETPENEDEKHENEEMDFDDEDFEDLDVDEDFDIEDEDLLDIEKEEALSKEMAAPPKVAQQPSQPPPKPKEEPTEAASVEINPSPLEELPLHVVVEVGRIQMSVKKLLELQPGNMLQLGIHPEAGVDLVVNGKRIARGEILRVGDVLGVRIIEIS